MTSDSKSRSRTGPRPVDSEEIPEENRKSTADIAKMGADEWKSHGGSWYPRQPCVHCHLVRGPKGPYKCESIDPNEREEGQCKRCKDLGRSPAACVPVTKAAFLGPCWNCIAKTIESKVPRKTAKCSKIEINKDKKLGFLKEDLTKPCTECEKSENPQSCNMPWSLQTKPDMTLSYEGKTYRFSTREVLYDEVQRILKEEGFTFEKWTEWRRKRAGTSRPISGVAESSTNQDHSTLGSADWSSKRLSETQNSEDEDLGFSGPPFRLLNRVLNLDDTQAYRVDQERQKTTTHAAWKDEVVKGNTCATCFYAPGKAQNCKLDRQDHKAGACGGHACEKTVNTKEEKPCVALDEIVYISTRCAHCLTLLGTKQGTKRTVKMCLTKDSKTGLVKNTCTPCQINNQKCSIVWSLSKPPNDRAYFKSFRREEVGNWDELARGQQWDKDHFHHVVESKGREAQKKTSGLDILGKLMKDYLDAQDRLSHTETPAPPPFPFDFGRAAEVEETQQSVLGSTPGPATKQKKPEQKDPQLKQKKWQAPGPSNKNLRFPDGYPRRHPPKDFRENGPFSNMDEDLRKLLEKGSLYLLKAVKSKLPKCDTTVTGANEKCGTHAASKQKCTISTDVGKGYLLGPCLPCAGQKSTANCGLPPGYPVVVTPDYQSYKQKWDMYRTLEPAVRHEFMFRSIYKATKKNDQSCARCSSMLVACRGGYPCDECVELLPKQHIQCAKNEYVPQQIPESFRITTEGLAHNAAREGDFREWYPRQPCVRCHLAKPSHDGPYKCESADAINEPEGFCKRCESLSRPSTTCIPITKVAFLGPCMSCLTKDWQGEKDERDDELKGSVVANCSKTAINKQTGILVEKDSTKPCTECKNAESCNPLWSRTMSLIACTAGVKKRNYAMRRVLYEDVRDTLKERFKLENLIESRGSRANMMEALPGASESPTQQGPPTELFLDPDFTFDTTLEQEDEQEEDREDLNAGTDTRAELGASKVPEQAPRTHGRSSSAESAKQKVRKRQKKTNEKGKGSAIEGAGGTDGNDEDEMEDEMEIEVDNPDPESGHTDDDEDLPRRQGNIAAREASDSINDLHIRDSSSNEDTEGELEKLMDKEVDLIEEFERAKEAQEEADVERVLEELYQNAVAEEAARRAAGGSSDEYSDGNGIEEEEDEEEDEDEDDEEDGGEGSSSESEEE